LEAGYVGVVIDVENADPACRPGARVNVLAKLSEAAISPPRVVCLIRNVLVIGVDRVGDHSTVSLAVKEEEARKLVKFLQWADSGSMLEVLPDGAVSGGDKGGVVNPDGDEALNRLLPSPPSP
jgi:hypothetical protein